MTTNFFVYSGNDLKSGKLSFGMGGRFEPESTLMIRSISMVSPDYPRLPDYPVFAPSSPFLHNTVKTILRRTDELDQAIPF